MAGEGSAARRKGACRFRVLRQRQAQREVRVRFQELDGTLRELEANGLWAICFQHEIDHLDGILFVDRLSP